MLQRHILVFDPIHHVMRLTPELKEAAQVVIDSPLFQRLRHIRQMGLADMAFPSATHTRFLHALGACHLSYRIGKSVGLSPAKLKLVVLAGLLHDVGHGPLSHAFEVFMQELLGFEIRHESWTGHFLRAGADWFDRIGLSEDERQTIHYLITGQGVPKGAEDQLMREIISSELDADRLDYLLRDSHFCGVSYGAVDLEWLLHCLVPIPSNGGLRLGLTHKGIGAAEEFFMARRLMYQNIYHHKKIIGFEALMVQFLKLTYQHLDEVRPMISRNLALFLEDLGQFKDPEALRAGKFESYRQLQDSDIWLAMREIGQAQSAHPDLKQIASAFGCHHVPEMIPLSSERAQEIKDDVRELNSWRVQLKKVQVETVRAQEDPLVLDHGQVKPLGQLSQFVDRLGCAIEPRYYLMIEAGAYSTTSVGSLVKG